MGGDGVAGSVREKLFGSARKKEREREDMGGGR